MKPMERRGSHTRAAGWIGTFFALTISCLVGVGPIFAGPILYSTTFGTTSPNANSLITVNAANGTQQLVGLPGQTTAVGWLTADLVDNLLYGTTGSETLYVINPNSGATSGTVTLSLPVSAIAASAQGTLYGLAFGTLGTINTATGQFSSVGALSLGPGYRLEAMAFSPGGTLYGVTVNDAPFSQQLITLNPATGATSSNLGSFTSTLNIGDITYASDGYIYATNYSYALLKIDPTALSISVVGFGSIGAPDGIAATSVPEPRTLYFVAASVGLLICPRKKISKLLKSWPRQKPGNVG